MEKGNLDTDEFQTVSGYTLKRNIYRTASSDVIFFSRKRKWRYGEQETQYMPMVLLNFSLNY